MPTSKKTPDGVTRSGFSVASIAEKGAWWMKKRLSACASSLPAVIASGSMSKAWSWPVGPSASRMPREWPPRPNVASTYTAFFSGPTILATTSRSSAGVCVPGACSDGRMPWCTALAGVTLMLRPPYLQPSQRSASVRASCVANVSHPMPLHLPVCLSIMSRASPTIGPAGAKNFLRSASVASPGRYLRKIS